MEKEYEIFKTISGLKFAMDPILYRKVITNDKDGITNSTMESYIVAEQYFPQLVQVIICFLCLFNGYTDFWSILLVNLISGIIFTLIWNKTNIYRIPGLAILSNLIGNYILRLLIHIIIIGVLSFTYFNDWKILVYCIIAGLITNIIKSLMSGYHITYKHNNEIAKYTIDMIKNSNNFSDNKNQKINNVQQYKMTDDENELVNMVNVFYKDIINKYLSIEKETFKIYKFIDFESVYLKYENLLKKNDLFADKMYALKNNSKLKRTLLVANEFLVELLTLEITLNKRLNDKANGETFTKEEFDILSEQKNIARDSLEEKLKLLKEELESFIHNKN